MAGAVNVKISDKELRDRLLRLNQRIGPITSTTRPVYLRKLWAAEAAALSPIRRSTGGGRGGGGGHRFSSDESDEDPVEEVDARPAGGPLPRRQIGTQPQPRPSPPRVYGNDRAFPSRPSTSFNAKISTQFHHDDDEEDDEEDEEDEGEEENEDSATDTWRTSLSSLCRPSINGVGQYRDSLHRKSTGPFGPMRDDEDDKGVGHGVVTNSYRNDTISSFATDRNSGFRGLRDNDLSIPSQTGPVQRNLTWNLSSVARDPKPSTAPEVDHASVLSKNKTASISHMAGKWPSVSMFLVVLVAVFFVLLGYMYWHVTLSQVDPRNNYLLCAEGEDDQSQDCIPQQSKSWVLELAKHSVNFISRRAGNFDCGYEDSRNITIQEFSSLMEQHTGAYLIKDKPKVKTLILKLFVENPHWAIRLYNKENEITSDVFDVKYLSSDKSQMSFWCRFHLSASRVLSTLFSVVLVAVLLLLGFAGFKLWKKWKEEETKEVLKLVESIIDRVKQQADAHHLHPDVLPYVAIAHVRDGLIPLMERQRKQRVWEKAVEFINTHESRIRTEDQKIESEDFTVWRWVSPPTDITKVWQGQAFGERGNRAQNYPPTLTTCLKVRNMFDADMEFGDDWHVSVEDAILEKCGPEHGILHVAADRASKDGCVYVRCRDLNSAGRAFKVLHGWWFDGKLVTVKYLREQRYFERFPEAAYAEAPLQPSNMNRSSLSRPFHSSIIETS